MPQPPFLYQEGSCQNPARWATAPEARDYIRVLQLTDIGRKSVKIRVAVQQTSRRERFVIVVLQTSRIFAFYKKEALWFNVLRTTSFRL
jgi:hypothetical protein